MVSSTYPLKRNELRANGEPNGPPRVVDGNNKNIDASKSVMVLLSMLYCTNWHTIQLT